MIRSSVWQQVAMAKKLPFCHRCPAAQSISALVRWTKEVFDLFAVRSPLAPARRRGECRLFAGSCVTGGAPANV